MEKLKFTKFATIYDRFLSKITDDMYVELTPEDTMKDLQHLLIEAIPNFEFPRHDLYDYNIYTVAVDEDDVMDDDFIVGLIWNDLEEPTEDEVEFPHKKKVMVDNSVFNCTLTSEEINILAILMMVGWVQRQVTSIEHTRMKYSGSDFKMTSQANHLAKLLNLLSETQRQSHHMQRLYKRRRYAVVDEVTGQRNYRSNWDVFHHGVYY